MVFGRVRRWAVRHRVLVDAIVIAPFLLFSLAAVPFYSGRPEYVPALGFMALTLALLAPLAVRRVYPLGVFAFIASVAFVQWLADIDVVLADMGILVAMFTVAAHRGFAWGLAALATAELGVVLAAVRYLYAPTSVLPMYSIFLGALWIAGLYVNIRRSYLAGLEERAERLERERDAQAQAAAAEERERIAREMHDVVAHSMSVMVVQADGASYAIDHSPANAKRALDTISRTGREALTEMRRLIGVLRGGGPGERLAPQPGMDGLAELLGQMRAAGLPVELAVDGVPRPLDHGVSLATYRIVQEGLTNSFKHAGPEARARVRIRYRADAVELRIDDDGRGAAARADGASAGHGLVGMRERAAMFGGEVDSGPRAGGGYRVAAVLPTKREGG